MPATVCSDLRALTAHALTQCNTPALTTHALTLHALTHMHDLHARAGQAKMMVDLGTVETRPHKHLPAPHKQYRLVKEIERTKTSSKQSDSMRGEAHVDKAMMEAFGSAAGSFQGGQSAAPLKKVKEIKDKTDEEKAQLEAPSRCAPKLGTGNQAWHTCAGARE